MVNLNYYNIGSVLYIWVKQELCETENDLQRHTLLSQGGVH